MSLKFENVRDQIGTGDFALMRGRAAHSRLIQWRTTSVYSHVGVFAWLEFGKWKRLFIVEALEGRGVQLLPAEVVLERSGSFDWFLLGPEVPNPYAVAGHMLSLVGCRYASPWQFIRSWGLIGRRIGDWLGLDVDDDPQRFHCSEAAAESLLAAGYHDDEIRIPAATPPEVISRLSCLTRKGTVIG
jgi:hypothetical protein